MKNGFTKTTVMSVAFAVTAALSANTAFAQAQEHHCGSTEHMQKIYDQNPGMEQQVMDLHQRSWAEGKEHLENNRSSSPPTYIIPVVFHVIHNYGQENISDAQIIDEMRILNEDFRKLNADTSQIVAPFDAIAADCEIEFRLAQLDPDGNCTNGIERIASLETYVGDDGSKLNQWPREKYLNIWVVATMEPGVGAYAYFPAAADGFYSIYDGIITRHNVVGAIGTSNAVSSRSVSHEVGHYLSLPHTWGFTNAPGVACGDDGIMDTPQTMGWTTCELVNNMICVTGVNENVQNYMEYAFCQRMFTFGQRNAMHYALNSSVSDRNNLWTNANLTATGCLNVQPLCAPHADFEINRRMVCEGGSVTLTDVSWSSATSWAWTLSGPTTQTSTQQNPTFSGLAAGWYDVTLVATNATGSDTKTWTNYIEVIPNQSPFTALYSESFENAGWQYFGYVSQDLYPNGSIFQETAGTAYTGSKSLMLNNYGTSVRGDSDVFITPAYDLRFNTGLQFTFRYAYATTSTDVDDNAETCLRVWSSTDCGASWQSRYISLGSNVPTAGLSTGLYVPQNAGQWELVTLNLPSNFSQESNVRFKFTFGSPADGIANNLYIDDINILSTNVGITDPVNGNAFSVYPNPGDGQGVISYTLDKQASVKCDIFDVSGRLISSRDQGEQNAGSYTLPVCETGTLAPGTYVIRVNIGDQVSMQRYVSASHE
jgi:PKD repeat protein